MASTHNLLVISDLHLGEDLRPGVDDETRTALDALEDALTSFLDHYAIRPRGGRPWRLVVNGDMIDFLSITVMPSEVGATSGWHPDDHHYGLGTRRRAAMLKLDRVLVRHGRVFDALGRFMAAGHDVAVVAGNHDAELHWRCVQVRLRDALRARRGPKGGEITFHPWCYFEEGMLWAEHGHQYDGYCSFEDVLDPIDPTDEELDLNVGSAIMRFIGNHHTPDRASMWDLDLVSLWRWLVALGRDRLLAIAAAYVAMVARLYGGWMRRWTNAGAWTARRARHQARLHKLARRLGVPARALEAVDRLRRPPVVSSAVRLAAALRLDRVALAGGAGAAIAAAATSLPIAAWPPVVAFVVAAAVVADRALAAEREPLDPDDAMRAASAHIRQALRPAAVVFGHSHEPVARHLGDGGWYFNTGTWIPLARPGLGRSFTHVVVEQEPHGVRAALFRWLGDRSGPF